MVFHGIKLFIYYVFIARLPHSRFCGLCRRLRLFYVCRVLKIMTPHRESYFENQVHIGTGRDLTIGSRCHINENVFLQAGKIGNDVMVAANVSILAYHHRHDRTDVPMIEQGVEGLNPVIIEDDVWIGRNSVILPGVLIGKGAVIAAGSVVSRNVKSYAVFGGVPAEFVYTRK